MLVGGFDGGGGGERLDAALPSEVMVMAVLMEDVQRK